MTINPNGFGIFLIATFTSAVILVIQFAVCRELLRRRATFAKDARKLLEQLSPDGCLSFGVADRLKSIHQKWYWLCSGTGASAIPVPSNREIPSFESVGDVLNHLRAIPLPLTIEGTREFMSCVFQLRYSFDEHEQFSDACLEQLSQYLQMNRCSGIVIERVEPVYPAKLFEEATMYRINSSGGRVSRVFGAIVRGKDGSVVIPARVECE